MISTTKTALYKPLIPVIGLLMMYSCNRNKVTTPKEAKTTTNITETMLSQMQWLNRPKTFAIIDSTLQVTADRGTDFFNNPEDSSSVGTAPFLFQSVSGDFVAKTLVEPDFSSQWNAVALLARIDSLHWVKFAFENSDATGPGIVTVVTKGISDDANGPILDKTDKIWLALAKKDHIYSMHWSFDNKTYKMARLTSMPRTNTVQIGIEAQSPEGDQATHIIHYFDLENSTIKDSRRLE